MSKSDLSQSEARRIALSAQGFDHARPSGKVTAAHLRQMIRRLGLVQLDFVNVLTPSHYLVPFSRLGGYDKSLFEELIYPARTGRQREFTEQWAHEASIVPMETWPLLRHRMETHRVRPWGFERFLKKYPEYVDSILEEVRARGPLMADAFSPPEGGPRTIRGSWHASVPRAVLEAHFGRGLLAVADRRPNFARAYDVAERVVPAKQHARKVTREEAQRELLHQAARSHGIGTAADLADYYRMPIPEARARIAELVAAGVLREVRVEGWREPAYLCKDAQLPRRVNAAALLSPFDPVVWFRPRTARLFRFDYRIEIFFPKEKRKWGYYVLPFLLGDSLVARVDLKADRTGRRLLVLAAHLEPSARAAAVAEPLAAELRTLADWLNLDSVAVAPRGKFASALGAEIRAQRQ